MKMEPSNKRGGSKGKWACFTCRYTVKHGKATCPTCQGLMHNVGPKFKTPPKRNIKEWAIIKVWWIDSQVLNNRNGRWVGHGPKLGTLREQKAQLADYRKSCYDHKIEDAWRRYLPKDSQFPYVTFK